MGRLQTAASSRRASALRGQGGGLSAEERLARQLAHEQLKAEEAAALPLSSDSATAAASQLFVANVVDGYTSHTAAAASEARPDAQTFRTTEQRTASPRLSSPRQHSPRMNSPRDRSMLGSLRLGGYNAAVRRAMLDVAEAASTTEQQKSPPKEGAGSPEAAAEAAMEVEQPQPAAAAAPSPSAAITAVTTPHSPPFTPPSLADQPPDMRSLLFSMPTSHPPQVPGPHSPVSPLQTTTQGGSIHPPPAGPPPLSDCVWDGVIKRWRLPDGSIYTYSKAQVGSSAAAAATTTSSPPTSPPLKTQPQAVATTTSGTTEYTGAAWSLPLQPKPDSIFPSRSHHVPAQRQA